ncbi:MAG: Dabb family protein [Acutalibacteraceae bacterium]
MVTHIVFWKLKDEAEGHGKRENAERIKEMLESLVGVIPGLIEARVGINENGGKYDAALYSRFENMNALKAYDCHPEHLKVRAFVKAVRLERESVDFEE